MATDTETFSPPIVCLCGSTRFKETFEAANERETLAGRIVLSVGCFVHQADSPLILTVEQKRALDVLHIAKIDVADEILILNVDGYVGASTRREIWYALRREKVIRWWEHDRRSSDAVIGTWFADWAAWHDAARDAAVT